MAKIKAYSLINKSDVVDNDAFLIETDNGTKTIKAKDVMSPFTQTQIENMVGGLMELIPEIPIAASNNKDLAIGQIYKVHVSGSNYTYHVKTDNGTYYTFANADSKVDYRTIAGATDLNHFDGTINGVNTNVIIYNILGVEGLAHAPVRGTIDGYMTVSRQEHDTHIWVEQTIYLPHEIYHRRYTVDTKYTDTGSWSEWLKLATTADTYNRSEVNAMIADLQEQIDNIDTSGSLPNGDEVSY